MCQEAFLQAGLGLLKLSVITFVSLKDRSALCNVFLKAVITYSETPLPLVASCFHSIENKAENGGDICGIGNSSPSSGTSEAIAPTSSEMLETKSAVTQTRGGTTATSPAASVRPRP